MEKLSGRVFLNLVNIPLPNWINTAIRIYRAGRSIIGQFLGVLQPLKWVLRELLDSRAAVGSSDNERSAAQRERSGPTRRGHFDLDGCWLGVLDGRYLSGYLRE